MVTENLRPERVFYYFEQISNIHRGSGNEKAVRAVGQANNKNPILLIIPCHRVIHKSGDISGFACGVEVKRYLLELEKGMRI